ncbi:G subunit of V-type ATPase [Syncephalastrum racemosum]|uniref:V-type proton ATPase subunit G n=1 Tax=Syncephalastrum racemosum TaxID=13706 RepID=A0A1X2H673_SYNRA|nr:G subunit of V-type ATPase [Syncephalastrum racemosum]
MAASSSQGINTLLEAEREAAKIVQKAKQYRVQRLKDARSEAAKEIEELKAQKNAEYQNFVAQHSGTSDQSLSQVDQETDAKVSEIQASYEENKAKALEKMLEAITNVQAEPHINARV